MIDKPKKILSDKQVSKLKRLKNKELANHIIDEAKEKTKNSILK